MIIQMSSKLSSSIKYTILTTTVFLDCPTPTNVTLYCQSGPTGTYGDTCTFSCNPGYELQGSETGTCLAGETWSGGLWTCVPLNCHDRITTSNTSC